MKINGLSGANNQIGMPRAEDSVSRNIQKQIANAQKRLQEISSNKEMSMEEKMQKRQEIQQQINDLNNQLRQHQIELRKEKHQIKPTPMEELLGENKKMVSNRKSSQVNGLSEISMKAILSADATMKQANIQGRVAVKMEGRAGVLQQEIKLDAARGGDTKAKEEELFEVEQKALKAVGLQVETLGEANEELEDAVKVEAKKENIKEEKEKEEAFKGKTIYYTPVDVCL